MGVGDWFSTFCDSLVVRDGGTIAQRYGQITLRLNSDFWDTTSSTAHSLYVGSYGRGTAIQGISDLDVIFRLPYSEYEKYNKYSTNGQSALLQAVRNSLQKTYSSSHVGGDGQVVAINFKDGITFEIVPGFLNKDDISFTFPDSNGGGSWRTTNPRAEIKAVADRDKACNGNLIRLCRMMRAWKNTWAVPMGGLLVDTLAYQFIDTWTYKDKSYFYYDYMSRDFFAWLSKQSEEQNHWRAPGSGSYVRVGGAFQYKAKRSYNIALEAIAHEQHKPTSQEYSAKQKWREIFGTSFPT